MELKDLVGKHLLTGVDEFTKAEIVYGGFEDCQYLNFILDGVTYTVIEDPDDGYRSSMKEIKVSDVPLTNMFAPIEVIASYKDIDKYGTKGDLLIITDAKNGKVILEIGTEDTNDYYPSFVANWSPENMAVNNETPF